MNILHACLAAGFLVATAAGTVRADDTLRRYQQSLRNQGFYYGPIDGNTGDETTQALRRYQIRNGLPVSGQLDDETRCAIDRGGAEGSAQPTPGPLATPTPARRATPPPPPPVSTPPPPPPQNLRRDNPNDDRADNGRMGPEPDNAPDGRQGSQRFAPSAALTNYFGGTPFEFAPPPVQADTVRRAQRTLTRLGFYDGELDGRPSHDLAEAVSNFQEVRRLRRSGRLDTATLGELRLLPDRRNGPPPRRGDDDDGRGRIYDGRIIH